MGIKKFNLKKMFILVTILSIVSKGFGFFRDMIITSYIGFGAETDGILLAISIPTTLTSLFQTTVRTTFSPIFSSLYKEDQIKANVTFNNIKNQIYILLFAYTIFFFKTSDSFVKIIAPGLNIKQHQITLELIQITSILILFYGIFYVFNGYLQAIQIYSVAEVSGILNNITIILMVILLYKKYNYYTVIYGYVLGAFIQVVYSYVSLKLRTSYRFKRYLDVKDQMSIDFYNMAKYVLLSSFLSQATSFADKIVGSFLIEGSISALNYANIVKNTFLTLFLGTLSSMLFPQMSMKYKESMAEFNNTVIKQVRLFILMSSYIAVITYANSNEIIRILFDRGKFTSQGVIMTSNVLKIYSLGFIFWSVRETFLKAFYSSKNTKIPVLTSFISLLINMLFNVLLSYFFDYKGLAISTNISLLINSLILIAMYKIKFKRIFKLTNIKKEILFLTYLSFTLLFIRYVEINLIKNQIDSIISILFIKSSIISISCVIGFILIYKKNIKKLIKQRKK
ncbi:murein biosynthesis integral membrane protein MurJ [Vagococcus lutrae]|uniref:murein biosynthesis integral membrane protein MurJ n=1 Tax=Vagococcus lutrae TaxID=81947 RepID=UPI00200E9BD2|nr:murein biosynthesis integral membrane protein MurJ [Vagococcus lutrae]UQF18029.1 murein biosynthesis integral membrane protein MurJ [Vagococcus lutrae]